MDGKKRYFFTRNNETIGKGHDSQEAAVKVAKQYQEYDHKIEGDFIVVKGVRKPVVYKVEERQQVHLSWQRTFNDITLSDLNDAKPARLDADKTAKPLTKIGVKMNPNHAFYGVKEYHDPQLINNETNEKIPLYRH